MSGDMGSSHPASLDETVFAHPLMYNEIGGISTNTVLPYFAESPFYDRTSNNNALTIQCFANERMYPLLQTREAFEGRLRTMQGLEYMVVQDPSENGTKIENSGVWVIRKQTRRKKVGMADEITPISSYYVIGMNVYMAPTLGDILGTRMVRDMDLLVPTLTHLKLSAASSLTKFFTTASALPTFAPATGLAYLPPASKDPSSSYRIVQSSKEASPMPGNMTPMPTTQDTTASSRGRSNSKSAVDTDYQSEQMLAESYNLAIRYGNEYMDENPVVGEPGSFRLAKSHDSNLSASMTTNKSSQAPSSLRIETPAPQTDVEPTPEPKLEDKTVQVRELSKGVEDAPIAPFTAVSPVKDKKDKKERKKSKAASAMEPVNPFVNAPKT